MKRTSIVLLCVTMLLSGLCSCTSSAPTPTDGAPVSATSVTVGTGTRITISIPSATTSATTTTTSGNAPKPKPSYTTPTAPLVAQHYQFTSLLFSDDFDDPSTIDHNASGAAGYLWYLDRPYGWSTTTSADYSIADSVITIGQTNPDCSYALSTYSKKGQTGFLWRYGYAEARIRFEVTDIPGEADGRTAWPSFWGISLANVQGGKWTECGELDIMEAFLNNEKDPNSGVYYCGALHDHKRVGASSKVIGTNLINATGYKGVKYYPDNEWHTYAALWTENYIAWYIDGVFMHSVTFSKEELPVFHFRDNPDPLPSAETERNWKGVHSVMNEEELVIVLGSDIQWPMQVDWVRIWGNPAS